MICLLSQTIDQSAETFPDSDAFRCDGEQLTFAQLVTQSDSLARNLIERGVARGDRVGILMPRCLESAVAVFGILKAGAAYVPIDPHTPDSGVRRLLNDCGIRHLIAHRHTAKLVNRLAPDFAGLQVVIGVDHVESFSQTVSWQNAIDSVDARVRLPNATEDDLAYVMYSSGSTGRPKGIMHTHRSGLAYAKLSVLTYEVRPGDRIGNHSPLHFDMSTFGYFSAPLAGATTVLIPEPYTKIPASLSQLMQAERLSIWYSVPAALTQLMDRGVLDQRDLSSLRWVMFGGEPFPPARLRDLMPLWPHARFSNVYGPAEVNQCTYYHVPEAWKNSEFSAVNNRIPIGKIWDNTEGLVLDQNDQPVSPGGTGELVVRSPTMMQGYWNRPDLNAQAFFRQSLPGGFVKTFYRTGDLVTVLDDESYVFLGRLDRQIKTRGHRVELDDVEAALSEFGDVQEAAAYAVRLADGGRRIASAVTARPECHLTADKLRNHLRQILPPYAIPESIHILDDMPRTATGKIDRHFLQRRAESEPAGEVLEQAIDS